MFNLQFRPLDSRPLNPTANPKPKPETKSKPKTKPKPETKPKPKPKPETKPKVIIYDIEIFQHLFYVLFKSVESGRVVHAPASSIREFLLTSEMPLAEQQETLNQLSRYVNDISKNPHITLVGFNSGHFDDPLLRYVKDLISTKSEEPIKQLYETAQDLINYRAYSDSDSPTPSDSESDSQLIKRLKKKTQYPVSLDLFSLLAPLPSLKKIEIRTRFHNVQDLPYPFDYDKPFTRKEIDTITRYCNNDVNATAQLYLDHGAQAHKLRLRLQEKYNPELSQGNQLDLESLSNPQTAEQTMLQLYANETGLRPYQIYNSADDTKEKYLTRKEHIRVADIIPDWIEFETPELQTLLYNLSTVEVPVSSKTGHPDTSFLKQTVTIGNTSYQMGGGGLHSVDAPAIITPTMNQATGEPTKLIDVDVASYYPAILINDNLHPEHIQPEWADLYRTIRDERMVAKSDPDRALDAHALKITINSLFGKTASRYSPFYDPALMLRITLTGQLALLMLIEMFEMESITVISANTDGVTVELDSYDQNAFQDVCNEWSEYTQFELEETHYAKIARRDVNNYCALTTESATIKRKGIFTPPSLNHDVKASVVQQMAEAHLLFDKPIHPDSLSDDLDIYDYLYHFSATKKFRVHTSLDPETTLQPSNRWYISTLASKDLKLQKTGGKRGNTISVPNSQRLKILNTVVDPTIIPNDLDIDYYIAQAEKLVKSITS